MPPFGNALDSLSANLTAAKASASVDSRSRNSTPTNGSQHRQSPQNAWTADQTKHTLHKENQRRNIERGGQQYRGGRGAGGGGGHGPQQGFSQNHSQSFNQNHSQNRRGSGSSFRGNQGHSQPHMQSGGGRFGGQQNYSRPYNNYSGRRPQSRPQQQRGAQNRIQNRPPKEPLKFEEDFDFDKANEDFKEIEEKMSNLKVANDGQPEEKAVVEEKIETKVADGTTNGDKDATVENDNFYNKTKSFFDNISCEAIEREKG